MWLPSCFKTLLTGKRLEPLTERQRSRPVARMTSHMTCALHDVVAVVVFAPPTHTQRRGLDNTFCSQLSALYPYLPVDYAHARPNMWRTFVSGRNIGLRGVQTWHVVRPRTREATASRQAWAIISLLGLSCEQIGHSGGVCDHLVTQGCLASQYLPQQYLLFQYRS